MKEEIQSYYELYCRDSWLGCGLVGCRERDSKLIYKVVFLPNKSRLLIASSQSGSWLVQMPTGITLSVDSLFATTVGPNVVLQRTTHEIGNHLAETSFIEVLTGVKANIPSQDTDILERIRGLDVFVALLTTEVAHRFVSNRTII